MEDEEGEAELLLLPDEPALSEGLPQIDIDGHKVGRDFLLRELALRHAQRDIVERVREPKFPANRRNYRKFCRILPLDAILCADK